MSRLYLAEVRTGREFETVDKINGAGIQAWSPKKWVFSHRTDHVGYEAPLIPNIIEIYMTDEEFHDLKFLCLPGMIRLWKPLSQLDERDYLRWKLGVVADWERGKDIADSGDLAAKCEYRDGMKVRIRSLDVEGVFRRVRSDKPIYVVDVEMLGRFVPFEARPVDVEDGA